jgi:hypothetical protein
VAEPLDRRSHARTPATFTRIRRRTRRRVARGLERLRRSLSLRVAVITSVSMVAAVGVMGGYVSAEIRDGLFENRVEQMLGDAAWRLQQTQGRLDTANASTLAQVQSTAADVVRSLQNPSSGMVGAMMLRSPGESSPVTILEPITSAALRELPSEDLRQVRGHRARAQLAVGRRADRQRD